MHRAVKQIPQEQINNRHTCANPLAGERQNRQEAQLSNWRFKIKQEVKTKHDVLQKTLKNKTNQMKLWIIYSEQRDKLKGNT